ncbi:vacuolar protein sorting-associated protein 52 A [Pelomyxa schiedti]|nr:vacuolar protein sorting-associated protein 52 A [Pelomyxa schiedti]
MLATTGDGGDRSTTRVQEDLGVDAMGPAALDITNEDWDPAAMEDILKQLDSSKLLEEDNMFSRAGDLRLYTTQIDNQITDLCCSAVQQFVDEAHHFVELHNQLHTVGSSLSPWCLQTCRYKAAREGLHRVVETIDIPVSLVQAIVTSVINEQYSMYLTTLEHKHTILLQHKKVGEVAACADVIPILDALFVVAAFRIRDFLMDQLNGLGKAANFQIVQQNVIARYSKLNIFLVMHAPALENEIVYRYIAVLSAIIHAHFSYYITNIMKLQYSIGTKDDLLGVSNAPRRLFGGSQPQSRANVFTLTNFNSTSVQPTGNVPQQTSRISILGELDSPPIIPHLAAEKKLVFPFEWVFRSINQLLVDTVCSEHMFEQMWFRPERAQHIPQVAKDWNTRRHTLFTSIFNKTLQYIRDTLAKFLENCFDCLGMLLMMRSTQHNRLTLARREIFIPEMDAHLDAVYEQIWARFSQVFSLQVSSIQSVKPIGQLDSRPHYVTRQYAEFCASLRTLNAHCKSGELSESLRVLRCEVDLMLDRLSRSVATPMMKYVFFINNYDLLLSVLREREKQLSMEMSEDSSHFSHQLEKYKDTFVDAVLMQYFSHMLTFLNKYLHPPTASSANVSTPQSSSTPNTSPPPEQAPQIITTSETGNTTSQSLLTPEASTAATTPTTTPTTTTTQPTVQSTVGSTVTDNLNPPGRSLIIDNRFKEAMENLIQSFNTSWKSDIQNVVSDIRAYFPNFNVAEDVLRVAMMKFVDHYTRWDELNKRVLRQIGVGRGGTSSFLPVTTVSYEIKKYVT